MVDRYTKTVLTIIAAALTAIAFENAAPRTVAQGVECGDRQHNACYVEVTNWPTSLFR